MLRDHKIKICSPTFRESWNQYSSLIRYFFSEVKRYTWFTKDFVNEKNGRLFQIVSYVLVRQVLSTLNKYSIIGTFNFATRRTPQLKNKTNFCSLTHARPIGKPAQKRESPSIFFCRISKDTPLDCVFWLQPTKIESFTRFTKQIFSVY